MNRVNFKYYNDKSGIKPLTEDEKAFLKEIYESGTTHLAPCIHNIEEAEKTIAKSIFYLSKREENKDKKLTELMHEIYMQVCLLREGENYEDKKD